MINVNYHITDVSFVLKEELGKKVNITVVGVMFPSVYMGNDWYLLKKYTDSDWERDSKNSGE
jgi:hypothetical protein